MLDLIAAVALLTAPAPAAPRLDPPPAPTRLTAWKIDPNHSELRFRVRHLVSRVSGTFTDWEGVILGDPADWKNGSVSVVVRTASISTNNQRRDTHLRSPDFFDVQAFPEMTFKSSSVALDGETLTLAGDLSIRGVTKPVVLSGTYNGLSAGSEAKDRVGFEVSTRINRLEFGLTWNRVAEGGGTLLGDEVTIQVAVEAIRQP